MQALSANMMQLCTSEEQGPAEKAGAEDVFQYMSQKELDQARRHHGAVLLAYILS